MDYIKASRELGKAIQATEEFKALEAARTKNDADEGLEKLIGEFNMKRMQLNDEMTKEQKDNDTLKNIDAELKELYDQIMANENMKAYNDAKTGMDTIMNEINTIIGLSANGQDPDTIDPNPASCGGSCSSCGGGCH